MRSHGTESHILEPKLHSATFKPKAGQGGLVRVALFWKVSLCNMRPSMCGILYHVTGSHGYCLPLGSNF